MTEVQTLNGLLPTDRCLLIAEIAQAHDGSLGSAHAYIDAVANAGADAVKFQTHIADAESTAQEPWRVRFSRQDETRFNYWKRIEFTSAQWRGLAEHATERGLIFLSSPFSPEAVDMLESIGIPAWKVASGEVENLPLLQRMGATGKPVLLSSGMSDWTHLDKAVGLLRTAEVPIAVFQCTTAYPCPPDRVGLNVLDSLRARYGVPVGLSDHSGTIFPGMAAAALGARMLEVHVVHSRESFGPDTAASVTLPELRILAEGLRFIARMLRCPVDKGHEAMRANELRTIFGRSAVAARDLPAGTVLRHGDVALKKPGGGISAADLGSVIGATLNRDLQRDERLSLDDIIPTIRH